MQAVSGTILISLTHVLRREDLAGDSLIALAYSETERDPELPLMISCQTAGARLRPSRSPTEVLRILLRSSGTSGLLDGS
jgi:hypothetical protein